MNILSEAILFSNKFYSNEYLNSLYICTVYFVDGDMIWWYMMIQYDIWYTIEVVDPTSISSQIVNK